MRALLLAAALAAIAAGSARAEATIDVVRARGTLVCGVSPTSPGFAMPGSDGIWRGIEADECSAIAAAVFGDPARFRLAALLAVNRLTALQTGEVDVLFANTTLTLGREAGQGVEFAAIYFYDGQGFMVPTASGIKTVAGLDGATICMLSGGTAESNVADWFRIHGLHYTPVLFESPPELRNAFVAGRCDSWSQDASSLAGFRSTLGARATDFAVLPEIVSNEPLAAGVRKGDDRWLDVVRWTHHALVAAEAFGITKANVDELRQTSRNPAVRRLLGIEGDLGPALGLGKDWAYLGIRAVGNYGEAWDRAFVPLGLTRGANNVWTKGGLMFAPPLR